MTAKILRYSNYTLHFIKTLLTFSRSNVSEEQILRRTCLPICHVSPAGLGDLQCRRNCQAIVPDRRPIVGAHC